MAVKNPATSLIRIGTQRFRVEFPLSNAPCACEQSNWTIDTFSPDGDNVYTMQPAFYGCCTPRPTPGCESKANTQVLIFDFGAVLTLNHYFVLYEEFDSPGFCATWSEPVSNSRVLIGLYTTGSVQDYLSEYAIAADLAFSGSISVDGTRLIVEAPITGSCCDEDDIFTVKIFDASDNIVTTYNVTPRCCSSDENTDTCVAVPAGKTRWVITVVKGTIDVSLVFDAIVFPLTLGPTSIPFAVPPGLTAAGVALSMANQINSVYASLGYSAVPSGNTITVDYDDPAGLYCDNTPTNPYDFLEISNGMCCDNVPTPCDNVISINFEVGSSPLDIAFAGTVTNPGNVIGYSWDFGDSNTSTLQNPTHTYAAPGIYNVVFCIFTNNGCDQCTSMTLTMPCTASVNADILVGSIRYYWSPVTVTVSDIIDNHIRFFVIPSCCNSHFNVLMGSPWVPIPGGYELPGVLRIEMPEMNPGYTGWTSGNSNYLDFTVLAPLTSPITLPFLISSNACAASIPKTILVEPPPCSATSIDIVPLEVYGKKWSDHFSPTAVTVSGHTVTIRMTMSEILAYPRPLIATYFVPIYFHLNINAGTCCPSDGLFSNVTYIDSSLVSHPELFGGSLYLTLIGGDKTSHGGHVYADTVFTQHGFPHLHIYSIAAEHIVGVQRTSITPGTYTIANRIIKCRHDPSLTTTLNVILIVDP